MERRRLHTLLALAGGVALTIFVAGRTPKTAAANVRVPVDPNEVLEVLSSSPGVRSTQDGNAHSDTRDREIAELKVTLQANPRNLRAAVRLARLDIQLGRETADPRYLGHAQAALSPWWSEDADIPAVVLVLRATIEQSLHDFESALRHLDRAIALTPDDGQAWLTRAIILTVLARYEDAKSSCMRVEPRNSVATIVCVTQIESLTGLAGHAYDSLSKRLDGEVDGGSISTEEREWAVSTLGEFAARLGDRPRAERHFRDALAILPTDAYARGVLADLLIDSGRFVDAVALLEGHDNDDALLLRRAIAERRGGLSKAREHIAILDGRFAASRARGDVVHRREEARFWLELEGDPVRALELARANWQVQREPWDARILLAAARAAKQPDAAADVVTWLGTTKLEDPALRALSR